MIMANLHLVTGYAGEEHITSNDQGSFNAALMGTGEFVLERGRQFEAQVISNNKVRIFDGDLLMQGRHIRLKENTYVDLFFENGTQGYKRSDLIAVRYEKDPATDIESASLVVIKGVPTEDAYVSSEKITGDILNEHALQNDTLLYKVNFDGLGIQEPEKVFSTVPTLETIKKDTIEQIEQKAEEAIQDVAYAAGEIVPLFGTESPTPETEGKMKQFFVNIENGELFICTEEGETYTWIKIGGGLGGVPLSDCKALALEEGSDQLTLKWEDPDNVVFNGEAIAEWAGTKVVRKEGSSPENVDDGILIADSTVRNQYALEGLQDTDVVEDTQYNYALFPYTAKNVYTMSDANRASGSLQALVYEPILADNTWEQISAVSKTGKAREIWNLGDEKDGYMIIGFDHDDLSDGSGKAGITFFLADTKFVTMNLSSVWAPNGNTYIAYPDTTINQKLESEYENYLPDGVKKEIVQVSKKYALDKNAVPNIATYDCKAFLFSVVELTGYSNGISKSLYRDYEGEMYEGIDKLNGYGNKSWWTRTYAGGGDFAEVLYVDDYNNSTKKLSTRLLNRAYQMYIRFGFCI